MSRFSQAAELDLSRFAGCALMEVFSQNYFPPIRKSSPYVITLGPHSHYWFVLRSETAASVASKERKIPMLGSAPTVAALLDNGQRGRIEHEVLPPYRTVGIDPAVTFPNGAGRPMYILDDREPVVELL